MYNALITVSRFISKASTL